MEHDLDSLLNILMIFGIKEKSIIFDPYNALLAIATNIPVCDPGSNYKGIMHHMKTFRLFFQITVLLNLTPEVNLLHESCCGVVLF